MRKSSLFLIVGAMILFLPVSALMAQSKKTPFLITENLPHLTKQLVRQWDNPQLALSEEQKAKLIVVRQETVTGLQELGPKLDALEKQVTEGIFAGKTPAELHSLVRSIAGLKAEATMIHLQCIHDTGKILGQSQLDILKQLSE